MVYQHDGPVLKVLFNSVHPMEPTTRSSLTPDITNPYPTITFNYPVKKLLLSPSPGTQDTASAQRTPFTHRSDMWAAGVVILEMYAGGLAALPEGRGDNALDLLETLLDNTSEATVEMEVGGADENRANMRTSMGRDTDTSRAAYNSGGAPQARATRATARERAVQRKVLRVEMPGGVLAVLRDIFQWEAGDRPSSMEVLRTP